MKLLWLLLLTSPAFAQLTTVTDTIVKGDGSRCSGQIQISLAVLLRLRQYLRGSGFNTDARHQRRILYRA